MTEEEKNEIAKALRLGKMAFHAGINASALDYELVDLISKKKVGDRQTVRILKAWNAGWTQANLAEQSSAEGDDNEQL